MIEDINQASHCIIHYGEIALKGKNRSDFEYKLIQMIKEKTALPVRRISGRLLLSLTSIEPKSSVIKILKKLTTIFGITSILPVIQTQINNEEIGKVVIKILRSQQTAWHSFRIKVKRSNKSLPFYSIDLERSIGSVCLDYFKDVQVDLDNPDVTVFIELVEEWAFIGTEKKSGPGGLPVGTAGKVLCLLSGGIDSPVAAYQMMRRGCEVVFIHFHSYPYTDEASITKVRDVAKILSQRQIKTDLFLVPFIETQKKIMIETRADYRVILYRRFMVRLAQRLARKIKAQALVTGECLGQVASQTIENISNIQEAVYLPIFRPLIGFDKNQIIDEAKQIGTYTISILPHDDCCTLFTPRHPVTRSSKLILEAEEKKLSVDDLLSQMEKKIEYVSII